MSKYWNSSIHYGQPTTSEIKMRSAESVKREKDKGKTLEPVLITGRTIAKNWWGKAWCSNLEKYADYESRLDRGKRYIRTGAVIDLKIENLGSTPVRDFPGRIKRAVPGDQRSVPGAKRDQL